MTLTQTIKNYPYFKVRNCTDIRDVNIALKEVSRLCETYGFTKGLLRVQNKLIRKREVFIAKHNEQY